jgi:hypothetical protein
MPAAVTTDQLDAFLESEHNNAMLFHQETIYRSLSAQLRSAVLYDRAFSCPFAPRGCASGAPPCANVRRLDQTSKETCLIRTYLAQDRVDPACVVWDDPDEPGAPDANARCQ